MTVAAGGRRAVHIATVQSRTWTTCEDTQRRRLGRPRYTHTLGRGSVRSAGAGSDSDVGSMILDRQLCVSKYEGDWCKMMRIYKDGRAGLRGPLLGVTLGLLSPKRQCTRRMIHGWHSGHAAVRCGHFATEDLQMLRRK